MPSIIQIETPMRTNKFLPILLLSIFLGNTLSGQSKHDYQWIMGYDYSQLPDQIISMDFNYCPVYISHINTVSLFEMAGSNTSMSDNEGKLLFYSNGCYVVNAEGQVMENGDTINPGYIQDIWCPGGGSPLTQGAISLPAPGSDSLYYVFNMDFEWPYAQDTNFFGFAPQRLYYHVINMSQAGGLGKVVQKNQVAVQDTLGRAHLQAVRHANGVDWWVITPKSHSNCYFLTLIDAQGVHPPVLECEGKVWSDYDSSGQAVFTPDGKKYIRFNWYNGINIFDFDTGTGELSNPTLIEFPNDTFYFGGAAVSPNSRFLYALAIRKLYQFDLEAPNIEASKILVGEWDGAADPDPTVFYLAALAPDNQIYISGISSHEYLHVIHKPDNPGLACEFEQRAVHLPSYNYATIPNFPQYRSQPTMVDCDSIDGSNEIPRPLANIKIYPNPASENITIQFEDLPGEDIFIEMYDLLGQIRFSTKVNLLIEKIDMTVLEEGMYIIVIKNNGIVIRNEKVIRMR